MRGTGELFVARALDRERDALYRLTVAATDGKFTAYTRVRVAVTDVNGECTPEWAAALATRQTPLNNQVVQLQYLIIV